MPWEYGTVIFEETPRRDPQTNLRVATATVTLPTLTVDREGYPVAEDATEVIEQLASDGWETIFTANYRNLQHYYLKRQTE
ncbi:MAG: hypothetical protein H0T73_04305 [Ardenticatenales bacterium]|nr:hypothetical protein [Ardenticatenales bacterium]